MRPVEAGGAVLVASGERGLTPAIRHPETGTPLPDGEIGEIWLSGPSVAAGYWGQPAHPAFGEGWLRTGDLGVCWSGQLYITGRSRDHIILRGLNHHPQDLEATLAAAVPALRPGCVAAVAVPDDRGVEALAVVAELRPGHPPAEVAAEVARVLRREHGVAALGVDLLPPRTIPKTSSGKLQRSACRLGYLDGTLPAVLRWRAPRAAAAPAAEDDLRVLLSQGFGIDLDEATLDAPLSSWGLDSVAAVELCVLLEERLGVAVELAEVLSSMTGRALLSRLSASPSPPSHRLALAPPAAPRGSVTHTAAEACAAASALWRAEAEGLSLALSLAERFVGRIHVADPAVLAAGPVLFLANHQVAVESLTFSLLLSGLSGRPVAAVAKAEHTGGWLPSLLPPSLQALMHPLRRGDPAALASLLRALPRQTFRAGRSLLVHVEGTRATAIAPTQRSSGAFEQLAAAEGVPVVPVRFVGGLPAEGAARLDLPYRLGRQDIYLGAPLWMRDVAPQQRAAAVLAAINRLGPRRERPASPGDPLPPALTAVLSA